MPSSFFNFHNVSAALSSGLPRVSPVYLGKEIIQPGKSFLKIPEEGRRINWPKRCENKNKDEDNSPKTLTDKNHQTSSQNFRQLIFLASLMVFLAFALSSLKEFTLLVKGSFFNFRGAAFRSMIAILHSLLNQCVLRLFEGEVFGIVSFAIAFNVSVKCFIRSVLFGSSTSLL